MRASAAIATCDIEGIATEAEIASILKPKRETALPPATEDTDTPPFDDFPCAGANSGTATHVRVVSFQTVL
nr:hypothetical protein [uncultured Kingella sp.]